MLHGAMTNAMYPRIALCFKHLLRHILHRGGGKWFDILIHKSVVVSHSHTQRNVADAMTTTAGESRPGKSKDEESSKSNLHRKIDFRAHLFVLRC